MHDGVALEVAPLQLGDIEERFVGVYSRHSKFLARKVFRNAGQRHVWTKFFEDELEAAVARARILSLADTMADPRPGTHLARQSISPPQQPVPPSRSHFMWELPADVPDGELPAGLVRPMLHRPGAQSLLGDIVHLAKRCTVPGTRGDIAAFVRIYAENPRRVREDVDAVLNAVAQKGASQVQIGAVKDALEAFVGPMSRGESDACDAMIGFLCEVDRLGLVDCWKREAEAFEEPYGVDASRIGFCDVATFRSRRRHIVLNPERGSDCVFCGGWASSGDKWCRFSHCLNWCHDECLRKWTDSCKEREVHLVCPYGCSFDGKGHVLRHFVM